jgi:hypothetical protein
MTSANYRIVREAIVREQQVTCMYRGHYRELCPHIIGSTGGEEKLLAWQFGGTTNSSLPPSGEWRCLRIAGMSEVTARDGRWHTGSAHRTGQTCVQDIDLDINVHVRTGAR